MGRLALYLSGRVYLSPRCLAGSGWVYPKTSPPGRGAFGGDWSQTARIGFPDIAFGVSLGWSTGTVLGKRRSCFLDITVPWQGSKLNDLSVLKFQFQRRPVSSNCGEHSDFHIPHNRALIFFHVCLVVLHNSYSVRRLRLCLSMRWFKLR